MKYIIKTLIYRLRMWLIKLTYCYDYYKALTRSKTIDDLNLFTMYEGNVDITQQKILCIFSHFDSSNKLDDYVIFYLEKLYNLGCAIIVVSTNENLPMSEIDKAKKLVTKFVTKKNIGYDFGSYAVGVNIAKDYQHFDHIIIANDSVYGPFIDLSSLITMMDQQKIDVMGITDSWRHSYYIHSYFYLFNAQTFYSPLVKEFWQNLLFTSNRRMVVYLYEIGFSQLLLNNNFKVKAWCDYHEIITDLIKKNILPEEVSIKRLDTTLALWKELIEYYHCPFIKIRLIRENPLNITNLWQWSEVISNKNYNPKIIIEHLKRTFKQKIL